MPWAIRITEGGDCRNTLAVIPFVLWLSLLAIQVSTPGALAGDTIRPGCRG